MNQMISQLWRQRKAFTDQDGVTKAEVEAQYPWATIVVEGEDGWHAFESTDAGLEYLSKIQSGWLQNKWEGKIT